MTTKKAALQLWNGAGSITFQSICKRPHPHDVKKCLPWWQNLLTAHKYQYYYRQRQVRKYAAQQLLALQAPETSKPVFVEVDADMYQKPSEKNVN